MFVISVRINGQQWYLLRVCEAQGSAILTADQSRAAKFDSADKAHAKLDEARYHMRFEHWRASTVRELETVR